MKYVAMNAVFGSVLFIFSYASAANSIDQSAQAEPVGLMQEVKVTGIANPDEKSYRNFLKAMDVFEQNRQMAPTASLRFKVYPRKKGILMNGLIVKIKGDSTGIPIQLANDQTFTVPRNIEAANDNASVIFNRTANSLTWRADIRSAGVPNNARRLGDLRLECKVALAADLIGYPHLPTNMLLAAMSNACQSRAGGVGYIADRAVFGITLVHGQRRELFPSRKLHGGDAINEIRPFLASLDWGNYLDRQYFLGDYATDWPDDTLLEFDYVDDVALVENQATSIPAAAQ